MKNYNLDRIFSLSREYPNLTESEKRDKNAHDGVQQFMRIIKIGKYSSPILDFFGLGVYERIFTIEEFYNLLVQYRIAKNKSDAMRISKDLDSNDVTIEPCLHLKFNIIDNNKRMRIRQHAFYSM